MNRWRHFLRPLALAISGLFLMTVIFLGCLFVTLFCPRQTIYNRRQFVVKPIARFYLWLAGFRVQWPEVIFPDAKTVYLFNHSSNIDIVLFAALGLPNTRFFLSTDTLKVLPLTLVALLTGVFYIANQRHTQRRIACFKRAESILIQSGSSVFASPEGERIVTGEIGPFNRGIFHLAQALHWTIVPLYFHIPHPINPWKTTRTPGGIISIHVLPPIATDDSLDALILNTRKQYVRHHRQQHRPLSFQS